MCLMPSYDRMDGTTLRCSADFVPLGGGRVERGPIHTRGETVNVGWTNQSTYVALWVTLLEVSPLE